MKSQHHNTRKEFLGACFLASVTLFSVSGWHIMNKADNNKSYQAFIEFDSAYGIQEGTSVRLRGLPVGTVININQSLSSILTKIEIKSSRTIIPKASLIETNQTGLLNDTIIDIVPLNSYNEDTFSLKEGPLSKNCNDSLIICNLSYLKGERGLNYDDLIRATTRISQRFDDPKLFYGLYYLIGNILKLSSNLVDFTENIAYVSYFFKLQLKDCTE